MFRYLNFFFVFSILWCFSGRVDASVVQIETVIEFDLEDDAWVADYSSAILIGAKALDQQGDPIANVRLYFTVSPAVEEPDGGISATGEGAAIGDSLTDHTGAATVRLPLVNGLYEDINFMGSNPTATQPKNPPRFQRRIQPKIPPCPIHRLWNRQRVNRQKLLR